MTQNEDDSKTKDIAREFNPSQGFDSTHDQRLVLVPDSLKVACSTEVEHNRVVVDAMVFGSHKLMGRHKKALVVEALRHKVSVRHRMGLGYDQHVERMRDQELRHPDELVYVLPQTVSCLQTH